MTGESAVVTADSDLIVTDFGELSEWAVTMSESMVTIKSERVCEAKRGNVVCQAGYPRALCAETEDAGGADCHAQDQGVVTAQIRLRAVA
ncbi:hypothetical protein [Aromatoleum aromaticum]|uniref:hypothetical protein n=1 Tax=Aromatoleum aromaticum TaxID=551760 RepID=UPI0013895ABE|nr:hypothetical protein [Aromatoleum aromaticum]